jgi:hypothetical protein
VLKRVEKKYRILMKNWDCQGFVVPLKSSFSSFQREARDRASQKTMVSLGLVNRSPLAEIVRNRVARDPSGNGTVTV